MCLISGQATPNLTPLLAPDFMPRKVVMLVSEDMRERARWLADVVRPRGIQVEQLDVADPWDLNGVSDQVLIWLDAQGNESSVALNVTGGTKPMAIAAQQAFAIAEKPVFYVHHERDEVLWLTPRQAPTVVLGNRLKLEPFLAAHGWRVIERPASMQLDSDQRRLTDALVLQAGSLSEALGTFNWYASLCEERAVLEWGLERPHLDSSPFTALVQKFESAGACSLQNGRLKFKDVDSRFFCKGGWLEQHVAEVLGELHSRVAIQDVAANLKVRSLANKLDGNSGSNELDLAFLAHNRLHIVECKTRRMNSGDSAADTVYKLDSLAGLGGVATRKMLVSYRELFDGDRQRAKDLGIQTIVGSKLSNLSHAMLQWIQSK
jgi:hypothetical protein